MISRRKAIAGLTAFSAGAWLRGGNAQRTYRIAVNLKTASALGLAIPDAVLARADRLIK